MNLIIDIAEYLKEKNERNYVMFMFGIYSGLRISDILKLKIKDVKEKKQLIIKEIKTKKENRLIIQQDLQKIIKAYVKNKPENEYLFKSQKGKNNPISRQQAYVILKNVANKFKIEGIGTHTLRKTFGYFLYKETKDIYMIKRILNHSDISITKNYIGLTQDDKDKTRNKLKFKRKL